MIRLRRVEPGFRPWGVMFIAATLLALGCAGAKREADRAYTGGLATVEDFTVHEPPIDTGRVSITVRGTLPDPCTRIDRIDRDRSAARIEVQVRTRRESGDICAQVVTPFERTFQLDLAGTPPGLYTLTIHGITRPLSVSGNRFDGSLDPL